MVLNSMGKGVFSSVIRARDNRTGLDCALKIVRNNETM
jgi:serine/threonine protein kinase